VAAAGLSHIHRLHRRDAADDAAQVRSRSASDSARIAVKAAERGVLYSLSSHDAQIMFFGEPMRLSQYLIPSGHFSKHLPAFSAAASCTRRHRLPENGTVPARANADAAVPKPRDDTVIMDGDAEIRACVAA
jgi:hypothetical protein